jgi:hypothetical protein
MQPEVAYRDGAHDFDFLHGRWEVRNRRLRARLAGADEWEEFTATNECRALPGGLANQDVYRTEFWPGFVGLAQRFYDPERGLWSIYWADNRRGVLDPPVVGAFAGDTGTFEGEDRFEGRPIRVRFRWSRIASGRPRWEQAFSADGGRTWETNWVMEMTRPAQFGADSGLRRGPVEHLGEMKVIELRRYTVREGAREAFSTYFTRYFSAAFQQLGALAVGEFHQRGNPVGNVWLRAFRSYAARAEVCAAFYDGPVWLEHRDTLNDLIVAYDDVLLLRPLRPDSAPPVLPALDPVREPDGPLGVAVAQILAVEAAELERVAGRLAAAVDVDGDAGVLESGLLTTLELPNNFPRHPVRADGPFLVRLALARDETALERRLLPRLADDGRALAEAGGLRGEPEILVLDPVGGSRLRWLPEW